MLNVSKGLTKAVVTFLLIIGPCLHRIAPQSLQIEYADRDRGIKLYQQGDMEAALKALRIGTQKFKDDGIAWHYIGLSLNHKGDLKGARKAFENATRLRPDFVPSLSALAHILLLSNKTNEAEDEANRALSLDRQNAEGHYVIGVIRTQQRSCGEALAHADAALNSNSSFSLAYLLKSQAIICDLAESSLKPWVFDGTTFKTSSAAEISKEQKIAKMKKDGLRFAEAAEYLERFLQQSSTTLDHETWAAQLEALRIHAQPANETDKERTVFSGAEVTTKLRMLSKPEPTYTHSAKAAGVEGTVVLRAVFAEDGTVKSVLILNPLPNGLTERAIQAAKKIKFTPATKDGRLVSTYVQLEYNFNLY